MKKLFAILLVVLLFGTAALAEGTGPRGQAMPEFTVTTTEGEDVSLSALLEAKDVVVVNIFTSWCPPCRAEFPEMEKVYEELSDRMEIVAVTDEPEDTIESIADYRSELGLTFPMGLGKGTGIVEFAQIQGYPTTLVVNKSGMVGYIQTGMFAGEEQFRQVVEYFLGEGYDGALAGGYNVYVGDQDMEPVPGVILNFCTATTCQTYTTDEEGMISFAGKPEEYHVQILKVPEGYSFDASFETVCDGSGDWMIIQVEKE